MYKSYAITIRPRDGITDFTIKATTEWCKKQRFAVGVIEKDNESRHLHIQVWNDAPKARGDVAKAIQRICERTIPEWDNAQQKVLRSGIKIAYSDWYEDYLLDNESKEQVTEERIIINNPPDKTMEYYPTEEEQNEVQTLKTATDQRYASLELQCLKYLGDTPITMNNVARWLAYATNDERSIKVITQQRDRTALCKSLYHYMIKSHDISLWLEKTYEDKKAEKDLDKLKNFLQQNMPKEDEISSDEE